MQSQLVKNALNPDRGSGAALSYFFPISIGPWEIFLAKGPLCLTEGASRHDAIQQQQGLSRACRNPCLTRETLSEWHQPGRTLDLILLHGEQGQVVGAREVAGQQVPQRQEALAGRDGACVRVEEVVDVAQRVGLREPGDAALRGAHRRAVGADSKTMLPSFVWANL